MINLEWMTEKLASDYTKLRKIIIVTNFKVYAHTKLDWSVSRYLTT